LYETAHGLHLPISEADKALRLQKEQAKGQSKGDLDILFLRKLADDGHNVIIGDEDKSRLNI